MRIFMQKTAHFLTLAAFSMFLGFLTLLVLSALGFTASSVLADHRMNQRVTVAGDSLLAGLALTAVFLAALVLLYRFAQRRMGKRSCAAIAALWTAAALCFVWAVGLIPAGDSGTVVDAAKRFAQGDFSPMEGVYFSSYSYQLGICLLMEGIVRLVPGVDLNLAMQGINCLLSAGAAVLLCRIAAELAGDRKASKAAMILYIAFVPTFLFNMFVYGVLPMVALWAAAILCFMRYTQTGRQGYGLGYALLLGAANVVKPNSMLLMLALLICAVIFAMQEGDGRILLWAALSVVLSLAVPEMIVRFYEARSGITLMEDVSMQLRIAMGMQDSMIAAGWYNGLSEEYWDLSITLEMEKAAARELIAARLAEFAANPAMAWDFIKEKFLTQWAEPSYDIMWWGSVCKKGGRFNGLAHMLFRDESPVRALIEEYMNIFQQAAYLLALLGAGGMMRERKKGAMHLMLPVTVLGGFFYHMLVEAKSQYIYPYMLLLIPFAARGLGMIARWIWPDDPADQKG